MRSKAYACAIKEENIAKISSSGGCYYAFAKAIINQGGVVYAACYDGLHVSHKRINRIEDINQSCGSKYLPSDITIVYDEINVDLNDSKIVLFVGTPCQCAGIRRFFGEDERLICIDFVCHGMPTVLAWKQYLKKITSDTKVPIAVNMRDKSTGWEDYSFTIVYDDGTKESQLHLQNPFIKGMLNDLYLRPSCYNCAFKGLERITDITLGDMWGASTICPDISKDNGISLLLIHSEAGMELFQDVKGKFVWLEVNAAECAKINSCITDSVELTKNRQKFFNALKRGERFDEVVWKLTKRTLLDKVISRIKRVFCKWQD